METSSNGRTVALQAALQWSHRLSAMETGRLRRDVLGVKHLLQWSHRLSAMETQPTGKSPHLRICASMEPPPFGDGNTRGQGARPAFYYALQWSHRLSAMETPTSGTSTPGTACCFNGATAFRRWKREWWKAAASHRRRFNGATAFRRWKRDLGLRLLDGHQVASMEPPPFGDGNGAVWHPGQPLHKHASMEPPPFGDGNYILVKRYMNHQQTFNGATAFRRWKRRSTSPTPMATSTFNGATAFRRWKRPSGSSCRVRNTRLQWSHRLSAMETVTQTAASIATPAGPSMEPPPFGDGNLPVAGENAHGRARPSMEPPPFGDGNASGAGRGHRAGPSDGNLPVAGENAHGRARPSMEPPPFGDGNERCASGPRERPCTFNGATAFRRWKRRSDADCNRRYELPSMEPPPFGDGNCYSRLASVVF